MKSSPQDHSLPADIAVTPAESPALLSSTNYAANKENGFKVEVLLCTLLRSCFDFISCQLNLTSLRFELVVHPKQPFDQRLYLWSGCFPGRMGRIGILLRPKTTLA